MEPNTEQQDVNLDQEEKKASGKGGWIATVIVLIVAIGLVIGLEMIANNELSKKDEEITKKNQEISTLKSDSEDKPNQEVASNPLFGFDTKIESVFKTIPNTEFLTIEKMAISKDGKYMFIKGNIATRSAGAGYMGQYYRSTNASGEWKTFFKGNGFTSCKEFDQEKISIAKNYASETGFVTGCLDDQNQTKNISDL